MNLPRRITKTPADCKVCGHCSKELPKTSDFFDRDKGKADGFKNWCKQCRRERRALAEAKEAAAILKTLDISLVSNLAAARPGGPDMPHATEIYQNVMALLGGAQGFAMHWVGTFIASKPGSQTRERMLSGMQRLSQGVSDSNKVQMPAELMSDEDLDAEIKKREQRMRIVSAEFSDARETEQSEPGSEAAAG